MLLIRVVYIIDKTLEVSRDMFILSPKMIKQVNEVHQDFINYVIDSAI